jgi:hypothetical protein
MLRCKPVDLLVLIVVFALSLALAWAGARGMLAILFAYVLSPPLPASAAPRATVLQPRR